MTRFHHIHVDDHAPPVVGTTEVAALAGVERNTVSVWKKRGLMPAPIAVLSCGVIWDRAEVEAWLKTRKTR